MIVVFPDHTHYFLGHVTKMPPCSNKVKPPFNIPWNQKTKIPPIPYMVLTSKFFWLPCYANSMGGRTMLNYLFRRWIGFRAVFISTQVFIKGRKMSSHICYRKTDVVYCLLHSRLKPGTLEKWNFEVFSFLLRRTCYNWLKNHVRSIVWPFMLISWWERK